MSTSFSMKEVAVAAGVSKATVSKVLSGKGSALRISPTTQSHVRSVASQMGYVPGPIIRYGRETIDHRPQTTDAGRQTTDDSPLTTQVEAEVPVQDPALVSPDFDIVATSTPSDPPPPVSTSVEAENPPPAPSPVSQPVVIEPPPPTPASVSPVVEPVVIPLSPPVSTSVPEATPPSTPELPPISLADDDSTAPSVPEQHPITNNE